MNPLRLAFHCLYDASHARTSTGANHDTPMAIDPVVIKHDIKILPLRMSRQLSSRTSCRIDPDISPSHMSLSSSSCRARRLILQPAFISFLHPALFWVGLWLSLFAACCMIGLVGPARRSTEHAYAMSVPGQIY